MDVLENAPGSTCAGSFDIDWRPTKPELANRVLLPILEDQYGKVLEEGKFQLAFEEGPNREEEGSKRRLAARSRQSPEIRAALDETVRTFNGAAEDPGSFDLLD